MWLLLIFGEGFFSCETKERFIAQKTCDGAEILTPQTPFGMTVSAIVTVNGQSGSLAALGMKTDRDVFTHV
jgi:hypothetical protein